VSSLVDGTGKNETLMDALAGTYVLFGARSGQSSSSRSYTGVDGSNVDVTYDAFQAETSPLADLVYAIGQTVADPNVDAALATSSWLMTNDEPDLALATNAALLVKAASDAHPEATLPATSALWDEILDVLVEIAAVKDADGTPGLLEGMLTGLADPRAAKLGTILSSYTANKDLTDYNRADINGPPVNVTTGAIGAPPSTAVDRTQPDQGSNRSVLQRFLQLVHDTNGVEVCNRPGAVVKARLDVPVIGTVALSIPDSPLATPLWGKSSFGECEVFHMSNMATFYMDSIVGKAQYVLRDKQLRDGVSINLGITTLNATATATTVHILEESSGLTGFQPPGTTDSASRTGFWTPGSSKMLMARPEWLDRNLFFPNGVGGAEPALAKAFADALNPSHAGTAACPTRTIDDPLPPSDPNYTPGGKIHLPVCGDGDWLDQRDAQTIFALETTGFYTAIAPLVQPFADRRRSDLLVKLLDVLHRHWADANVTPSDSRMSGEPAAPACTKDGVVRYEPILATAFAGDLLPALQSVVRTLAKTDGTAPTVWLPCVTRDASGACQGGKVSGVRALAYAMKSAVDPEQAATRGLLDRRGNKTATRSDGTTNAQVTPVYLLIDALHAMDNAFTAYAQTNPKDAGRLTQWRRARSKIVDQFLSATNASGTFRFADAALPKITPVAISILRQELAASCPEWPNGACTWAGSGIASDLASAIGGPLFARGADLVDTIRKDDASRLELEKLVTYLLDSTSGSDALESLLVTSTDGTQELQDDLDLVPIYHALASALAPGADPSQRSLADANIAMLTRLTAAPLGANGAEDCTNEIDPNQVLTKMLEGAVTPIALTGGRTLTPVEVILDTITDVNRSAPQLTTPMRGDDYGSVAANVADFLENKERGIEQFYAVVKTATTAR
jgi:hypothetical protein